MSNRVPDPYTIKPSLKAFPYVWLWLLGQCIIISTIDETGALLLMAMFCLLPVLMVLCLVTYGRSYQLKNGIISKINHITGEKQSINLDDVKHVAEKPKLFGYGHMILTLKNGRKFKMKNIKLDN